MEMKLNIKQIMPALKIATLDKTGETATSTTLIKDKTRAILLNILASNQNILFKGRVFTWQISSKPHRHVKALHLMGNKGRFYAPA